MANKILSALARVGRGIFNNRNYSRNGLGFYNSSGVAVPTSKSKADVVKDYSGWVYTCANINAAGVASCKLRLYGVTNDNQSNKYLHPYNRLDNKSIHGIKSRKNISNKSLSKINSAVEVVEITNHPVLDLLSTVNSFHNYFETMEILSIGMDLVGDAYWYIVRDKLGRPSEIWNLMPQFITIVPSGNFIKGYLYGRPDANGNGMIKFRPDEIIHFKTPNPNNYYYGIGCAEASCSAIQRNSLLDTSENTTLMNLGRPSFVVKYKGGHMDGATMLDIEKMWNQAYQGPHKAGKIKVMDSDFDINPIGFKPNEMEYQDGRKWTLKEICGAFGVPYSMVDSSDTKKATSESAKLWHAQNALVPRLKRIEEKLNEKLIPLYDDRIFVCFDDIIPEDALIKMKSDDLYLRNGTYTINEVRKEKGLTPFPDDKYNQPLLSNIQVIDVNDESGTDNSDSDSDSEEATDE